MKFNQAVVLIQYINDEDYEPTEWEAKFLESVANQQIDLSGKQAKCLNSIYAKATGGGRYVK